MTPLPDKCWRGNEEVKGGRPWTKPEMKRRSDGFICLTDSLLSFWTCIYVCVPSADSWFDMMVLLPCFSFPPWRWTSLYSHCPSSFLLALLTFLHVALYVYIYIRLCRLAWLCALLFVVSCVFPTFWSKHPGLWCWELLWWWHEATVENLPRGGWVERKKGKDRGIGVVCVYVFDDITHLIAMSCYL